MLTISRPITETVESDNNETPIQITVTKKFQVMLHEQSLYFVRQGGLGSKVCDLTAEQFQQLQDLDAGVEAEEQ